MDHKPEEFVHRLMNWEPDDRRSAAMKLVEIGPAAVDSLIDALNDPVSVVRVEAVWALGEIGDRRAMEPLICALNNEDAVVRWQAAKALVMIGWQPEDSKERAWCLVASEKWDEAIRLGATAVEPLIDALNVPYSGVQEKAVWALGEIGSPRATETLLTTLNHGNRGLREIAAKALAKTGSAVVEIFIASLKNENGYIRRHAAEVLGDLGDTKALKALRHTSWWDKDKDVRLTAKEAIKKIKHN